MTPPSTPRVDGRDVKFNLSSDYLEWQFVQDGTEKRDCVRRDAVIAVIPDKDGPETSSALLAIGTDEVNEAGESGKHPRLRALKVSGLPEEVRTVSWVESLPAHLQGVDIHVIISIMSGARAAKQFYTDVLKPFLEYLFVRGVQVHETQSAETIVEFTSSVILPKAKEGVSQTVILLSGDGGLVDVIKSLYADPKERDIEPLVVALVPMGTGNAMANSTGLMKGSTLGLSTLVRGAPEPVPVLKTRLSAPSGSTEVVDVHGAVVASWGLHASLVADSDTAEYRRFGVDRFKMAAQELLHPSDGSESHRYKGDVTLTKKNKQSGEEYREVLDRKEHMYVLTTLVSELEKGFQISPHSKPLDGQLRMVHFGPVSPEEAMRLLGLAYQGGKHVDEESLGYEDVNGIKIEFEEEEERWRRVCIDGKIVSVAPGGWMEVRREEKNLVKLVIPRGE